MRTHLPKFLLMTVMMAAISLASLSHAFAALMIVDMKTDYLPGDEFIAARATLVSGPSSAAPQTKAFFTTDPVTDPGVRVAEFDNLNTGTYTLDVELLAPDGSVLDSQRIIVSLSQATAVTALIARNSPPAPACEEELEVAQIQVQVLTVELEQAEEQVADLELSLEDVTVKLESTQNDLINVQGLLQEANDLLATLQEDSDGDGVIAVLDQCPQTEPQAEVDSMGCSIDEFCEGIEIDGWRDRLLCRTADWNEDEIPFWARDCTIRGGVCEAR